MYWNKTDYWNKTEYWNKYTLKFFFLGRKGQMKDRSELWSGDIVFVLLFLEKQSRSNNEVKESCPNDV